MTDQKPKMKRPIPVVSESGALLARGDSIGRFMVLGVLEKGKIGVTYRVFDPESDKQIALILLSIPRLGKSDHTKQRSTLLTEAQALSQLSHPNIVAVHNVGTFKGDVYVTMELTSGKPFNQWLAENKPDQRQIVEVILGCARGLEAAHSVGVLHRDFRPENIIVQEDGQAKVKDFGLAQVCFASNESPLPHLAEEFDILDVGEKINTPDELDSMSSVDSSGRLLYTPLTQFGALAGDPSYMAPEQYLFEPIDERTDQFSLCVVLYEALYGQRPFSSRGSLKRLQWAIIKGKIDPPKTDAVVRKWLLKILEVGLSADPKNRYAHMRDIIHDLEHNPTVVMKRTLGLTMVALLMGLAIVLLWLGLTSDERMCKAVGQTTALIWNQNVKNSLSAAFINDKAPHAKSTRQRIERMFDKYINNLSLAMQSSCEATHVHTTQTEQLGKLRHTCLTQNMNRAKILLDYFTHKADSSIIDHAIQSLSELPMLARCADKRVLQSKADLYESLRNRQSQQTFFNQIEVAKTLLSLGKYNAGYQLLQSLGTVTRLTNEPVLLAEYRLLLAKYQIVKKQYAQAEQNLRSAAKIAAGADDDALITDTYIQLVTDLRAQSRFDDADLYRPIVNNSILRVKKDSLLTMRWYQIQGDLLSDMKKYAQADEYYQKSLTLSEQKSGQSQVSLAYACQKSGQNKLNLGEYLQADLLLQRALSIGEQVLGPKHPAITKSLYLLGQVGMTRGKYKQALKHFERALAIRSDSLLGYPLEADYHEAIGSAHYQLGDYLKARTEYKLSRDLFKQSGFTNHPRMARVLSKLGSVQVALGEFATALALHRRALNIIENNYGPNSEQAVPFMFYFGRTYALQNDHQQAKKIYTKAIKTHEQGPAKDTHIDPEYIYFMGLTELGLFHFGRARDLCQKAANRMEERYESNHPAIAHVLDCIGKVLMAGGKPHLAREYFQRSYNIRESAFGEDNVWFVESLVHLANTYRKQHLLDQAIDLAHRAHEIISNLNADPKHKADVSFILGRVLWESGQDRRRAKELVKQARSKYIILGRIAEDELKETKFWLDNHSTW